MSPNNLGFFLIPIAASAVVLPLCSTAAQEMSEGQRNYTEACGGCHGLLGQSDDETIPQLKGRVGYFLCTRDGREYLVRLPNVAFSSMDDRQLAEALNFMVFGLGEDSVPSGEAGSARPFSEREVGRLRKQPLKATDLLRLRGEVLSTADPACIEGLFAPAG